MTEKSNESQVLSNKPLEMEPDNLSSSFCLIFALTVLVGAIFIILEVDESDCESPIRWLLRSYAILSMLSLVLLTLYVTGRLKGWVRTTQWALFFLALLGSFSVVLFVFANVWIFEDEDCQADFPAGYTLAMMIIVWFYMTFGFVVLALACATVALCFTKPTKESEKHIS